MKKTCLLFLAAPLLAVSTAQAAPPRDPALTNVAGDYIECAVFYNVTANCLEKLGSQNTTTLNMAQNTAMQLLQLARRVYQKQGMLGNDEDKREVRMQISQRQPRMQNEAGDQCQNLSAFMEKRGSVCSAIASNPNAHLNKVLSQSK